LNYQSAIFKWFFPLFFISCAYEPSNVYQKEIISNKIKTTVEISTKKPKESAFLTDALNEAVYTVFGSEIDNKNPTTKITLKLSSSSLNTLDYDENGFPILYRSSVNLKAIIKNLKTKKTYTYNVRGNYDFAVSANSIINDQLKFNAFQKASTNALNKLLAEITKDGAKNDN